MPSTSDIPIFMLAGVIIVSLTILSIERLMKAFAPFFIKRTNGINDQESLDLLRREFAVTVSTTFANNLAPFLNAQMDIQRKMLENQAAQNSILQGVQHTLDAVATQNENILLVIREIERQN